MIFSCWHIKTNFFSFRNCICWFYLAAINVVFGILNRFSIKCCKNNLSPPCLSWVWGGGGQGCLNLLLPVPFNPGSCHVYVGSRLFFLIAKYCITIFNISPFHPLPATLGIPFPLPFSPASHTPPIPFYPSLLPPCTPLLLNFSMKTGLVLDQHKMNFLPCSIITPRIAVLSHKDCKT